MDSLHTIILRLEESIKGQGKILAYAKNVEKNLGKATKAASKYTRSTKNVSKSMSMAAKAAFRLGKSLTEVVSLTNPIIMLGAAVASFMDASVQASESMVKFAAISGMGSDAVATLREEYTKMSIAGDAATISVLDLSRAMSDFASQGFPQMMMATSAETIKFVGNLRDSLRKGLGSTEGADALGSRLTQAFGEDMISLRNFKQEMLEAGDDIQAQADVVARHKWVDKTVFQEAFGALTNAVETAKGSADGAISSFLNWENAMTEIKSVLSDLGQLMVEVFGPSLGDILSSVREWIKKVGGRVQELRADIEFWGLVVKVTGHNFIEIWKMAYNTVSGILKTTVAGWGMLLGEFISWFSDDAGQEILDWADNLADSGKKAFKEMANPDFLNLNEEIIKAHEESERALKRIGEESKNNKKEQSATEKILAELYDTLHSKILPDAKTWAETNAKVSTTMQTIADITKLIGSTAAGEFFGGLTDKTIESNIRTISETLKATGKDEIATARERLQLLKENNAIQQRVAAATEDLNVLLDSRKKVYADIASLQEKNLADLEADLTLQGKIKGLSQARLAVSQALYGTPALAVEAQVQVLKTMVKEKKNIEEQIAKQKSLMALLKSQGVNAEELQLAQEKLLDLETQRTEKTEEQLNLVKQLRDGYLDAIQAQAFGAGRFSKIIMTSEKNLMRALEKRVAKENYLLGRFGTPSTGIGGVRFGATPGEMTTAGGQPLSRQDILAHNQAKLGKMAGAAAGAARQAQNLVMGMSKDTGLIDKLVDNILPKVVAASALKGTTAITTVTGAGMAGAASTPGPGTGGWASGFRKFVGFLERFGAFADQMAVDQNAVTTNSARSINNQQ